MDSGGGWLIFRTGPSEFGVHPNAWEHEGQTGGTDQQFEVSLICDDLRSTISELTVKGAVRGRRRAGQPGEHRAAVGAGSRCDDALPAEVRPAGDRAVDSATHQQPVVQQGVRGGPNTGAAPPRIQPYKPR